MILEVMQALGLVLDEVVVNDAVRQLIHVFSVFGTFVTAACGYFKQAENGQASYDKYWNLQEVNDHVHVQASLAMVLDAQHEVDLPFVLLASHHGYGPAHNTS